MRIVLASASPRRKELLSLLGWEFEIMVSDVEEVTTSDEPGIVVEELSAQKAKDIFCKTTGDVLVIGADTVVAYQGRILGKPQDAEDAKSMLSMLSGDTHEVYTGVTLYKRVDGKETSATFHECTEVTFYELSAEDIMWYLSTGECNDKAGSYGIQGYGTRFVKSICGDYNNVVGLPVAKLYQVSRSL